MPWNCLPLLKEIRGADLVDSGLATTLVWLALHALKSAWVGGRNEGLLWCQS